MPQIVNTPFTFIDGDELGEVYRPYIFVKAYSKFTNSWRDVRMVVDSGADYTLLPQRYAVILGIDLDKECKTGPSKGIGGEEKIYQYRDLPIKIGEWERKIPVGFLMRDGVPPLLGRLGCTEILKIIFADKRTIFEI